MDEGACAAERLFARHDRARDRLLSPDDRDSDAPDNGDAPSSKAAATPLGHDAYA